MVMTMTMGILHHQQSVLEVALVVVDAGAVLAVAAAGPVAPGILLRRRPCLPQQRLQHDKQQQQQRARRS